MIAHGTLQLSRAAVLCFADIMAVAVSGVEIKACCADNCQWCGFEPGQKDEAACRVTIHTYAHVISPGNLLNAYAIFTHTYKY